MAKHVSLQDAVRALVSDGMSVAMEGFTHLIPFAAGHEIIRQGLKDLTLIRMTPDIIYDQLVGTGAARKLVFSYAGNPGAGLLHRVRDAVENAWPVALEIEEHSHAAMANAYHAGASNLPSAVLRGYRGTDLAKVNGNIRFVECPFTGESLACVPALRPDVTIIHAQRADRKGNVEIEGISGVQKEAVLAASATIVTVEEIVDDLTTIEGRTANSLIIPNWCVDAVSHVPGGAIPSYATGFYPRDNSFYIEWSRISSDRDRFQTWINETVLAGSASESRALTFEEGAA